MLVSAGARFLAALGRRSTSAAAISKLANGSGIMGSDDRCEAAVASATTKYCIHNTSSASMSNNDSSSSSSNNNSDSSDTAFGSRNRHDSASAKANKAPPGVDDGDQAFRHAIGAAYGAHPSTDSPGSAHSDSTPVSAPGPASRRDKDAAAETIYPSSRDDNMGVQKNWFNALFSQLNVVHRTGMVPHMKGRQKEIFCAVEREFEGLWERHVRGKGLEGNAHRGMLLCCLAIATHRVLRYESGDDEMVREVVRTNLGGVAVGVMMRLHRARLWLLLRLLAEDPYKEAVRFLPSLQGDLGTLVSGDVAVGSGEATWTTRGCAFYSVLAAEDATELLPEFCCQFGMQWLEAFAPYGVRVGLEQSLGFGDECCLVRISRPGAALDSTPSSATTAPSSDSTPTSVPDNSGGQSGAKQA